MEEVGVWNNMFEGFHSIFLYLSEFLSEGKGVPVTYIQKTKIEEQKKEQKEVVQEQRMAV